MMRHVSALAIIACCVSAHWPVQHSNGLKHAIERLLTDDYACKFKERPKQYDLRTMIIIKRSQVCDGKLDCPDGDDEECTKCPSSPLDIEGGWFSGLQKHMPVGTHVAYTCHYGYHMVSSDVSVCLRNGSWSSPPTCARVSCGNVPKVQFGEPRKPVPHSAPYFASELVEYECMPGFEFGQGKKSHVTCQQDGSWSESPVCIFNACPDFTYGMDCKGLCGACLNGVPCNKVDGSCPSGCEPGLQSPMCVDATQPQMINLGCFADTGSDWIEDGIYGSPYLTPGNCMSQCLTLGYTYAAVQIAYGSLCHCANSFNGVPAENACISPCNGNPSLTCGGPTAINVYQCKQCEELIQFLGDIDYA